MSEPGPGVTALKLYLAIVGRAGASRERTGSPDAILLTYGDLSEITDVSRAMVAVGLRRLDGLIRVEPGSGRRPNSYRIEGFPGAGEGGWAKLPWAHLLRTGAFSHFSSRSRLDLAALKLYLLFLAFRDNATNEAAIAYEKIQGYTGLGRREIRRGVSKLIESELVTLYSGRDTGVHRDDGRYWFNRYVIRGLERAERPAGPASIEEEA